MTAALAAWLDALKIARAHLSATAGRAVSLQRAGLSRTWCIGDADLPSVARADIPGLLPRLHRREARRLDPVLQAGPNPRW